MTTTIAPDLIPVRALNQVSYCPRLYYLEYVDSVMPINEFVEDGLFQHRRVNDPALANRTRKEGDVLRTRSVSLSSERLGITGKLDLLEEDGEAIRPVETKRSAAPKNEDGTPVFWENDAIQLCAQALLVEESLSVSVTSGIIYYVGSKARVDVPFDESLRARTLDAIALIRDLASRDVPPEPLPAELRHRCFGCSLAPVCLPEETLYFINQPETEEQPPNEPVTATPSTVPLPRVIPANDDKAVLYVQEQGAHVGRRGEHLVVSLKGEEHERVPIVSIRQVVVFGNVQVSTQALQTLAEAEVPVAFLEHVRQVHRHGHAGSSQECRVTCRAVSRLQRKRTVIPVLPRRVSCLAGLVPLTQEPAHGTPQRPRARPRLAATHPTTGFKRLVYGRVLPPSGHLPPLVLRLERSARETTRFPSSRTSPVHRASA